MFSALKDLAAKSRKPTAITSVVPHPPPVPVPTNVEEDMGVVVTKAADEPSTPLEVRDAASASSSSAVAEVVAPSPPVYFPTTIGRCLRWRVANIDALLLEISFRCSEMISTSGDLEIQAALPPMLNIRANDSFGINDPLEDNTTTASPQEPFDVDRVEAHAQSLLEHIIHMGKSSTIPALKSLLQELLLAFTDFRFVAAKAQISVVDTKQRNYQSRLQEIRHEFVWSSTTSSATVESSPPPATTLIHANARLLHAVESLLGMATAQLLVPCSSSGSGDGGAPTITTYRRLISATNSLSLRLLVSERTSLIQEALAYQTRLKALLPLLPILASTSAGAKRPRDGDGEGEGVGGGISMDVLAERHSIYRMPQSVVSTGHTLLSSNTSLSYRSLLNTLFFEGRRKFSSMEQLGNLSTTEGISNISNGSGGESNALKFPRLRAYMLDRPVSFDDVDKKRNADSSSDDDDAKKEQYQTKKSDSALTINKFFARCTAASKGDIRTALHKVSEAHVTSGWEPIFDSISQAYLDDSKGYSSPQYNALMAGGEGLSKRGSHLPHVLSLCADSPDGAITTAISAKYTSATAKDAESQALALPLPPKLSTCLIDIMDHVWRASSMLVTESDGDGGVVVGSWKGRLTEVSHALEDAENAYGLYTMGTDKWRSGISGGSVHMRRKLEKINKVHITHVMNNPVVKAAMLTVKTLVNDVSSMVEEAREGYQYTDAIKQQNQK